MSRKAEGKILTEIFNNLGNIKSEVGEEIYINRLSMARDIMPGQFSPVKIESFKYSLL